jgi:Protein of unknown function (DUF3618)
MAERSSELDYMNEKSLMKTGFDDEDNNLLEIRSADEGVADVPSDEAEQIREQIEETRSQMSETIDAIQEKLSFANISEQVKDQVSEQIGGAVESAKEALVGNAVNAVNSVGRSFKQIGRSEAAGKIRQNPWILSVIGLGVGALLVNSLLSDGRKKKKSLYRYEGFNHDEDRVSSGNIRRSKTGKANDSTYQTPRRNTEKSTTASIYESVGNAANSALGGVTGAAGSAYESVGTAAGATYESIGKASSFAYEKAGDLGGQMKKNYNHYIEENPLAVGAVALAIGAAVGFAIPLTQKENEYMGELRDNVVEKAQSTAQEAIGSVKQVASDAQKLIVEEVKSQTAS